MYIVLEEYPGGSVVVTVVSKMMCLIKVIAHGGDYLRGLSRVHGSDRNHYHQALGINRILNDRNT